MEWYNHPSSLGYDGQDVIYPTDGMQCVYYAAPDNGSMHSAYSSYPIDPSFVPDGSFMPQEYVADPANSTCQIASTPYYVPAVLPYGQESLPGSATAPLISNVAFLPGMPSYAATSAHAAFPLVAPVTTKSDIAVNQPVQSTIVSSKQFQNHAKSQKIQLHNPVAQKQELSDRSMVPIKLPHASQVGKASHCQASAHLIERPVSATKPSPMEKLSGNNCFGYASSDLQKWAAAEKFQPSSKSSAHLNGPGQKVHLSNEHRLGDSEKPSNLRNSAIVVKSYTSRLPVGNPDGTILIRTDEYNKDDLRVHMQSSLLSSQLVRQMSTNQSSTVYGQVPPMEIASWIAHSGMLTGYQGGILLSVNGSGHFCGMAEMVGPVDFHKDMDFWSQDKWTGCFPVRWHIVKDIPNYSLQHITLQNNENKPVTHSRDTQEIPYIPGMSVLKIFKDIKVNECLFDDFMRYEVEEAQYKPHRRCKLSYNAPDFVPVSQRTKDVSANQQTKSSSVLIDRTSEIQNVSEKPHDPKAVKPQEPCVELSEKKVAESGKENGQETQCSGSQSQEDAPKTATNQPPTSSLKTGADGKQQYWKKVENPRQHTDSAAQGTSKPPEKRLNGIRSSTSTVSESVQDNITAKLGSLKISSENVEAERKSKSSTVGIVTIGSMPVRVDSSMV
ncbi:hypothetical protein HU200_039615 [Digitaria exilis]|uniref:YTH domain-containing family protein n=1 Tax=Digitaria exilis TaxID=1010633 RepID=A0A835BAF9_9POAL|nr:hypothetical protein HU200_039615 [Digitaria exilis]